MRMVPFPDFRDARSLRGVSGTRDPRDEVFNEAHVDLDLRECSFVRPAAVLWCIIYSLLARRRGSDCRLLVPENVGVCVYLKSIGLFGILHDNGVEADDRDIPARHAPQLVLSLTRFDSEPEVEQLSNQAYDNLHGLSLGAANVYPLVSEVFAELAMNAVQHAQSPVGAYGLIQFYDFGSGPRFVCGVADGGMGIRRSLARNPALRDRVVYDWVAIELALRERVSGTNDPTRGIGLYGVAEDMRRPGHHLVIHSGIGSLQTTEDMQTDARRTKLFPGTLAYASIPT